MAENGLISNEPSTTVCVGNLPTEVSPREFRLLFKFAPGVERCFINHTKKGGSVGYARFSSLAEAQAAIDYLNGFPMDEDIPRPLKVFMSSTQLRDAVPGQVGQKRPLSFTGGAFAAGPPMKMFRGAGMGMGGFGFGMGGMGGFGMGMGFGRGGFGKGRGRGKGGVTSPTSVYVGGVPHDWDEATVQSLFEGFGGVTNVSLNRGTNPVGNIAFVHFTTAEEAQTAIQNMNNYPLDGVRHLTVRANTSQPRPF